MGGRFWIALMAAVFGIGVAAFLLFLLVGSAYIRWGGLGSLLVLFAIVLGIAWLHDRREQQRYEEL